MNQEYVESMVFCEIWPESSLVDKDKRVSANSFILNSFLVMAANATPYANLSIVDLDRSIRR